MDAPPRQPHPAALALVAALGFLAFFGGALVGRGVFFAADLQLVHLPARHYLVSRLARGGFPEWYPYDGLGGSFVGNVVTGALHPFGALELFGSPALAMDWSVILAHAAAASGLYALLRRFGLRAWPSLGAGLAYAFSGYLASMDSNLSYLLTAGALPWALWGLDAGLEGRAAPLALGALALASCALGGDPQGFAVAAALAAALALGRASAVGRGRALGRLALYAAWTTLLCAVQAIPAMHAFGSVVAGLRSLDQVQWFSMAPLRLLDLVVAHPFVESARAPQPAALFAVKGFGGLWADSLFLGAPALLLSGLAVARGAPRSRPFALLAALSLLLALGHHLPLYGALYRALPFWRAFRYPEKLLVFTTFSLCALAGLGLQSLADGRQRGARFAAALGASAVALWAAAAAALSGPSGPLGRAVLAAATVPDAVELAALWPGFARQLLATAAISSAASLLLLARWEWLRAIALGASLLAGNRGLSQSYLASPALLDTPPRGAAAALAAGRDELGRLRLRWDEGDLGGLYGIESAEGYLPIAGAGLRPRLLSRLPAEVADRAFAVRFRLDGPDGVPREVAAPARRIRLSRAIPVGGPDAALEAMLRPGFDPVQEIALEGGAAPCGPDARARVEEYAEERVRVATRAGSACALFVADGFDPGWSAAVDGVPAPVLPADLFGRAVLLPEGEHRVELTYRAPGLRAGALCGLAGLGWIGLSLAAAARRSGRRRRAAS